MNKRTTRSTEKDKEGSASAQFASDKSTVEYTDRRTSLVKTQAEQSSVRQSLKTTPVNTSSSTQSTDSKYTDAVSRSTPSFTTPENSPGQLIDYKPIDRAIVEEPQTQLQQQEAQIEASENTQPDASSVNTQPSLRRSTRQRRASKRYSPTCFCFYINTINKQGESVLKSRRLNRQQPEYQYQCRALPPISEESKICCVIQATEYKTSLQPVAGKVIITLLMLALLFMNIDKCSGANDELLNDLLGKAYICPRHADAMMFEFGPLPRCIQKQSSEQVKTVYITPYFKKILSEPFPLYSCVVEIETTATNMGFFGSKGIVGH